MALIKCSECGREISDSAVACPQCGAPGAPSIRTPLEPAVATPPKKSSAKYVLIGVLAVLAGGSIYVVMKQNAAEEARHQAALRAAEMERAAAAAEVQRRAEERRRVEENPTAFLDITDLMYFDKGIVNSYRQLVGFTLLNRSPFHLKNLAGTVEWLDAKGESVGSVPFSLGGSLPSGDTKKFSAESGTLKSGTIQTEASKAKIQFTRASIVE